MSKNGKPSDLESASIRVFNDFEKHSSRPRVDTELAILSTLREQYPGYSVTLTPTETGIIYFARAGQAEAKLDTTNGVVLREHKPGKGRSAQDSGTLKDKVRFGK